MHLIGTCMILIELVSWYISATQYKFDVYISTIYQNAYFARFIPAKCYRASNSTKRQSYFRVLYSRIFVLQFSDIYSFIIRNSIIVAKNNIILIRLFKRGRCMKVWLGATGSSVAANYAWSWLWLVVARLFTIIYYLKLDHNAYGVARLSTSFRAVFALLFRDGTKYESRTQFISGAPCKVITVLQ